MIPWYVLSIIGIKSGGCNYSPSLPLEEIALLRWRWQVGGIGEYLWEWGESDAVRCGWVVWVKGGVLRESEWIESLCSTNTSQLTYAQVLWFHSFITPSQSLYSTNNITTTHYLTQQAVRITTAPLFTSPCSVLHPYPLPLRRWRLDRWKHIAHTAQPESLQKQDALHEYIT